MARKFFAVFALLLFFLTAFGAGYDYRGDDAELVEYINALCEDHGLAPELIYAVIERESSWQADALNAAGNCIGLMQISTVNLGWLSESLGVEDLYDPFQNVLAGISMLASYVETYGDYHMALMCYNCGCGGAQKLFDQGIYSSAYSRWIVERMEALDAQSYPVTADTQPQSYHSQDADAGAGVLSPAGQLQEDEEMEADPEQALDGEAPQMLNFQQQEQQPEQPESALAAEAQAASDIRPQAVAVPEQMQEERTAMPSDGQFTVIYARDTSQQEPARPVCPAVSAK